jgi:hypothetical protein
VYVLTDVNKYEVNLIPAEAASILSVELGVGATNSMARSMVRVTSGSV